MEEFVRRFRIDFALTYALYNTAMAEAGKRHWTEAHARLEEALRVARSGRNGFAEHLCMALEIRILAQEGQHRRALALSEPNLICPLASARAELLASRALALASASRLDEAAALVEELHGSSSAIETRVLVPAVEAVIAVKSGDAQVGMQIAILLESAFDTGALDLLVTAYRSAPELLMLMLDATEHRSDVAKLVSMVGDEDLAAAVGQPIGLEDLTSRLSPREREVLGHLQRGLTNRQIADALFIAESTVKVHAHRIYDKLGVRSRTAIAIQALLEGKDHALLAEGDQATSAMGGDS
jgi:DNA-binding NarL/FixJ family response regulator